MPSLADRFWGAAGEVFRRAQDVTGALSHAAAQASEAAGQAFEAASGYVAERRNPPPAWTPARADPAPDVLPNRAGFVQGVPAQGFNEDTASAQAGSAQAMSRADFLQELWEVYCRCPWAFASVNAIARTVTAGGLRMKWDADTGKYGQPQPEKPREVVAFERLLAYCNPTQDIRQLSRNIVADLQVFADAYVEVVWFAGIPVALYNQDSPTTIPLTDQHGAVTGYRQTTEDGRVANFKPEQIIHITLDSARPSVFGLSPTHAAEEAIVAWMYLHACEKEGARRGLPPNVHADLPAGTPDTDVQKWQQQYQSRNIGPANIGTPITTKGGGKVSELQREKLGDILAAKQAARDEIIAAYGVPPAKLGIIESGNLGGGTGSAQEKTFMLDVVKPVALLIAEKFQFHLAVKAFGIKGWHVEYPTTDYRDDKVIADIQDQQVRLGARTLNDLRRELGRPPVEGGDDAVLVARQDIILWSMMANRSTAAIAALGRGIGSEVPGPAPAVGTGPSKGQGGSRDSKGGPPAASAEAVAKAVKRRLRAVTERATPKPAVRQLVYDQLAGDFPQKALKWVLDPAVEWDGPHWVSADRIDTSNSGTWLADEPTSIMPWRRRLRRGKPLKPVILVRVPGSVKYVVSDGRHRVLASIAEGRMIRAYVAHTTARSGGWDTMHLRQYRSGSAGSPAAPRKASESTGSGRYSKDEAGYAPATTPGVRCRECVMWDDGRCSEVAGDIDGDYQCALFQAAAPATGSAA